MDIQWNKLKLKIKNKNVLSSGSIKLNGITGIYGDETKNVLLKEIWKRLTSTPKTNKFTTYHNKIKRFEDFFIRISLSPRILRSQTVRQILSEYYEIKYYKRASTDDLNHFLRIFELNSKILKKNCSKLGKKEAAIISLIAELIKGNMIYFIENIDGFLSLPQFVNLIEYFSNGEINSAKTLCFSANDPDFAIHCSDVLIFSKGNVESMYRNSRTKNVSDIIDSIEIEDNVSLKDSEDLESLKDSEELESLKDSEELKSLKDSEDLESLKDSEELESLKDSEELKSLKDSEELESLKDSEELESLKDSEEQQDALENSEEQRSSKNSENHDFSKKEDEDSIQVSDIKSNCSEDEEPVNESEEKLNMSDDIDILNTSDASSLKEVSMKDSDPCDKKSDEARNSDDHDEKSISSCSTTGSTENYKSENISTPSTKIDIMEEVQEKENNLPEKSKSQGEDESTESHKSKQNIKGYIQEPEESETLSDSLEETSNINDNENSTDFPVPQKDDVSETPSENSKSIEKDEDLEDSFSMSEKPDNLPDAVTDSASIEKGSDSFILSEKSDDLPNEFIDSELIEKGSGSEQSNSIRNSTTTNDSRTISNVLIENSEEFKSECLDDLHSETNNTHSHADMKEDNEINVSGSNNSGSEKENISNFPEIVRNEVSNEKENALIASTEGQKTNVDENQPIPLSLESLLEENGFVKEELLLNEETTKKKSSCLIIFYKAIFLAKVFSITKQSYHGSFNSSAARVLFNSTWKNFATFTSISILSLILIILCVSLPLGMKLLIKLLIKKSLKPHIVLAVISSLLFIFIYLPFSTGICLIGGFLKDLHYDNKIAFVPKTTAIQVIGMFLNIKNCVIFSVLLLYMCIVLGFDLVGHIAVFILSLLPFCVILEQINAILYSTVGSIILFLFETIMVFAPCIFMFLSDNSRLLILHAIAPIVSNMTSLAAMIVQRDLNSKIVQNEVTSDEEIANLTKLLIYLNKYNHMAKTNIKYIVIQGMVVLVIAVIYILFYFKPLILRRKNK